MKSILVINTDFMLSKGLKTFLEANNYKVYIAPNLHEADKYVQNNKIDVLICNDSSPNLDKNNSISEFDMADNNAPVILLSNNGNKKGVNHKVFEELEVPVNYHELLKTVERSLIKKKDSHEVSFAEDGPKTHISTIDGLKEFIAKSEEKYLISKENLIYKQQKNATHIYMIAEGLVKTFRMDEYGKELITGIYKKEDLFGFYSFNKESIYPESAQALKNTFIYRFPIKIFREILMKNNNIAFEFAQLLSDYVSNLKSHMLDLAYSSVLKKTSKTLLLFAENILKDPSESINLSRRDLASVAGISTESLIRSLAVLKKENLIDIKGRNIKIIDPKKLQYIK